MRTGCALAAFRRVSSKTPFFRVAVTLSLSISEGRFTTLRISSERLSTETVFPVFPFFSSFEDSPRP